MKDKYNEKYLCELADVYKNRNAVSSEIIRLRAILNLPKGTEHFLSDVHGEHEAFLHIRKNASGVIRRKVDALFSKNLSDEERAELSTLIYYPEEKLDALREKTDADWYIKTIERLLAVCRLVSEKYTRSKVRDRIKKTSNGYDYIIDELLWEIGREGYREQIISSIIEVGSAEKFTVALTSAIKSLVIDHLHIVGDIFDRGPRADIIIDELMREESIDVQWGNHDVLWLGAAAGSAACIAAVLNNSITYKNLDVIEIGYGISLRPLSLFASEIYRDCDVRNYMPKGAGGGDLLSHDDDVLIAKMHKAISVIQFKLEGECILRNPGFDMNDRLLLDKIDRERGTVLIRGKSYKLRDVDFPTVDINRPYELTDREREVIEYLKFAFMRSEKLQKHARFLYEVGGMYTVYNRNLLFHGSIPLDERGDFLPFPFADGKSGRAFMDFCDKTARQGYFAREGSRESIAGKDFLWFLWCGKNSPLSARERITTFERLFVEDKSTWEEPKNHYYLVWENREIAERILREFSLGGVGSYIINGHIPINKGENPIKAGGSLIVIDGGFCRAYQSATGIAGYTLIYNAEGIRLSAHESFSGKENAIKNNADIISDTVVFKHSEDKIRVRDTDVGAAIREKISDLTHLLSELECGNIKERRP